MILGFALLLLRRWSENGTTTSESGGTFLLVSVIWCWWWGVGFSLNTVQPGSDRCRLGYGLGKGIG